MEPPEGVSSDYEFLSPMGMSLTYIYLIFLESVVFPPLRFTKGGSSPASASPRALISTCANGYHNHLPGQGNISPLPLQTVR